MHPPRLRAFLPRFLAIAVIAIASPAHAQWWDDADLTFPKFKNLPDYKPKYTQRSYTNASLTVNSSLQEREFAKVERMYDEFLATKPHSADGKLLMGGFLEGLDGVFRSYDEAASKQLLEDWEKKLPNSKVLPLAKPIMLQRQAWKIRGGNYAGQVPGESMRLFAQKLEAAWKVLGETQDAGRDSPLWYWAALVVAGSSGAPPDRMDAIFTEAVKRFPDFLPIYYTRMNYLLPQWGGSFEEVDNFIRESVVRTERDYGSAFYVWLYLDVVRKNRGDPFQQTELSWPRMRKGFEDMIARYPDPFNKNVFATFACRARDKETTARLLAELGPSAQLGAWSEGYTTESCRAFALAGA